ncbi:MAG: hypothetical protein QOK37_4072 [Thermoanaerobaculia bacterium]|jgi:PAS domain S-box-containing protein|nr:hypothetical protein [Thermoanaerobaculia bacterium]
MNRILILDDRPINRQYLSTLLSNKGFETREASDGRQGLVVTGAWKPDLAIVDLDMPVMNGIEFVQHLRQHRDLASIPIIFYTASYQESEANKTAEEWGIQYVLIKPSEPEAILAMVDRALGRSAQPHVTGVVRGTTDADFAQLQSGVLRMAALVELQLEIAAQEKPSDILKILSRATRNIVSSEYSFIAILDDTRALGFWSPGKEVPTFPLEDQGWPPGWPDRVKELMREALPIRATETLNSEICALWPVNVRNCLGVPFRTAERVYGWASLMNRRDLLDYSLEDERMLLTMVTQAALAYENLLLAEKVGASEQRFRALVENSVDGILVLGRDATIVYASPAITRILGYDVDAVTGTNGLALVHSEDRPHVLERIGAVLDERSRPVISEWRALHRDGSWRYIAALGSNAIDDPAVRGIILNYRDVTEQRLAAEALDRMRRQGELILQSIADGVLGIDLAGNIIFCNPAAAAMLGWVSSELVGLSAHETMHHSTRDRAPLPRARCPIHAPRTDGIVRTGPDDLVWRKDGSSLEADYVATPMRDGEGKIIGAVEVFRDITNDKMLKRRFEQAVRVDSLGRIAASVVHEFNNVLMGILPFAEVIHRGGAGEEQLRRAASQILSSVARGRGITQDILRITRKTEPSKQAVDVTDWLEQIASEIRALVGERISVEVRVPAERALSMRCDPWQVQQVLTNLALNARDAMPAGGVITLAAERHGRRIHLIIADNGSGISPETLPHIFEPLFTTKRSGSGLGLAVAHQLVVSNGGTITVQSSTDQGTRFQIDLPVDPEVALNDTPNFEAGGESPNIDVRE